jgi:hypothetical protein
MTALLTYNGFAMGGTDYDRVVASIEGLDMPGVRSADVNLGGGDGALGGIDALEARTITITLELAAGSQADWYTVSGELRAATAHRSDELPLTFQLYDGAPELRVYCRPRRRNVPVDIRQAYANATVALQFFAPDPRIYSEAENTGQASAPSLPEGFTFPRAYDYDFGDGGSAEVINAFNAGDAPAPWTAVVYGPCEDPTIIGPGGSLRWEGTLTAGESVHFDAHPSRETVLVGGSSSQFGLLSDDSDWWLLEPGSNNVVLSSGDGQGTIDFRWRDTWWSVV